MDQRKTADTKLSREGRKALLMASFLPSQGPWQPCTWLNRHDMSPRKLRADNKTTAHRMMGE